VPADRGRYLLYFAYQNNEVALKDELKLERVCAGFSMIPDFENL
jgi:hypothetical protein